jgi:HSP20 family protein
MKTNNLIKFGSPFFEATKRFFDNDFNLVSFPSFERTNVGQANIKEQENEYIVELSVPGLKKENVKINLENDILTVSFEDEKNKEEKGEGYYRREFYSESFERSFTIPKNIKKDDISAKMEDGILVVKIPKTKEEKRPDNIEIKVK